MTSDEALQKIEELEAEIRQQRRLNQGLQGQVARILDQLAKLEGKKPKPKKRKGKRDKRPEAASGAPTEAPTAPERRSDPEAKKARGVPRRTPLPDRFERNTERHAAEPFQCCAVPWLRQVDAPEPSPPRGSG